VASVQNLVVVPSQPISRKRPILGAFGEMESRYVALSLDDNADIEVDDTVQ
jgi:hypothetical protein